MLHPTLRALALATKGFMPEDEGDALHAAATAAAIAVPGAPFDELAVVVRPPGLVLLRPAVMDTLPFFRSALHAAGLESVVVAVVGAAPVVAAHWSTPVAFLFIDGGHGVQPARDDFAGWTPHVAVGGTLAIHDVFPDPADGGRPPYEEIYLPAIAGGPFELASIAGSLRTLRRVR